ncbi:MAG: wax ester/triacylglycerol synthase domain-containing protein [Myxococcota bacterium]
MARVHYERLSPESVELLDQESSRARAHTAMVLVFDPGPLRTSAGGVDIERIQKVVGARLVELPRLRSKLRRIPLDGDSVWVDDAEFDLSHHLRHSCLPKPGNREQLCRTAARISASRLDRSRPLWDCWIIEGLEGDRFAIVLKMHKALAHLEGADLVRSILSHSDERVAESPSRFRPRPAPSPVELFSNEVLRGWSPSRRAVRRGLGWVESPTRATRELGAGAKRVLNAVGYRLRPAGESPFDGNVGPHRTFAFEGVDLAPLQDVRQSMGGTVHDLVLAIATGALRRLLMARHVSPVTIDLRAVTPVLEMEGETAKPWTVELPIWEEDAVVRLDCIREQTGQIRSDLRAATGDMMTTGEEWNASRLLAIGARSLKSIETGQLAVLQAPGPQKDLYLDGALLEECYGVMPLQDSSALGMTILSYRGRLFFAFNGESDLVPDVDDLPLAVEAEVLELIAVAAALPKASVAEIRGADGLVLDRNRRRRTSRKRKSSDRAAG